MFILEIKKLLVRCLKVHERHEEIRKEKRERYAADFNFFTLLTRYNDEIRHTRVLASLLDPKGSHGQGARFLDLFLEVCDLKSLVGPADYSWSVTTEKAFPTGRRIDVFVESSNCVIGIENKIDASEGYNQLQSYADSLENYKKSHAVLVYLTPDGREPDTEVINSRTQLVCIGYGHESPGIQQWLKACINMVGERELCIPRLQDALEQYSKVIDIIMGTNTDHSEISELAQLINSKDQMLAASAVERGLQERRILCHLEFWEKLDYALRARDLSYFEFVQVPRRDHVEAYYGGRKEPFLSVTVDTGVKWCDFPVGVTLEMLSPKRFNNLTHKVLCVSPERSDPFVMLSEVPDNEKLIRPIQQLRTGFEVSPWSFGTADMYVPCVNSTLDMHFFSGIASGLVEDDVLDEVVTSIAEDTWHLCNEVREIVVDL